PYPLELHTDLNRATAPLCGHPCDHPAKKQIHHPISHPLDWKVVCLPFLIFQQATTDAPIVHAECPLIALFYQPGYALSHQLPVSSIGHIYDAPGTSVRAMVKVRSQLRATQPMPSQCEIQVYHHQRRSPSVPTIVE